MIKHIFLQISKSNKKESVEQMGVLDCFSRLNVLENLVQWCGVVDHTFKNPVPPA